MKRDKLDTEAELPDPNGDLSISTITIDSIANSCIFDQFFSSVHVNTCKIVWHSQAF